jgi:hypothetical protein
MKYINLEPHKDPQFVYDSRYEIGIHPGAGHKYNYIGPGVELKDLIERNKNALKLMF